MASNLFSPDEVKFATSVFDSFDSQGDKSLLRINYEGAHSGTEWFVRGSSGAHPLRDVLISSANGLMNQLSLDGSMRLVYNSASKSVFSTKVLRSFNGEEVAVELGSGSSSVFIPMKGSVIHRTETTYTNSSIYDQTEQITPDRATSSDSGIKIYFNDGVYNDSDFKEFGSCEVVQEPNYSKNHKGIITSLVPRSWPLGIISSIDEQSEDKIPNVDYNSVFWPYGIKVVECSIGSNRTLLSIDFPAVLGFSRRFSLAAHSTGKLVAFCYYVAGEQDEVVWFAADFHAGDMYYGSASARLVCVADNDGGISNRVFDGLSIRDYYPLTWNSRVLGLLNGFADAGIVTESSVNDDGSVETYESMNFHVSSFIYEIDKSYYNEYLSTGLGLGKAVSEDRRKQIMASWSKIPEKVFLVSTEFKGPWTLKEHSLYKEYGRRRAKACKDNNFMDLQFNSEYVYKQVENKLSQLSDFKVVAFDGSLIGGSSQSAFEASLDADRVCTVVVNDEVGGVSRFSYTTDDGLSGTFAGTSSGIDTFFDTVMPCTFTGAGVTALEAVLTSEGDVFKLPTQGSESINASVDMRLSSVRIPSLDTVTSMLETFNRDQSIMFACHQVTDYAQILSKGPALVKSMTGNPVRKVLLQELAAYKESKEV